MQCDRMLGGVKSGRSIDPRTELSDPGMKSTVETITNVQNSIKIHNIIQLVICPAHMYYHLEA
jgi:hypothetical protein